MKKLSVVFALLLVFNAVTFDANAFAQDAAAAQSADPSITANGVIGEVVAVDAAAKQVFVKTDAGSVVVATVADNTVYKRVDPANPSLNTAKDMTFAELGAGDRVFARGKVSDDRKTVMARMVIVSTKADLTAKQEAERAEWKQRGIVGVVSAVNAQTKEITLQTRGAQGPQNVTIPVTEKVKLRRYAPDSVLFSAAKPSTFEAIQVGDQLRAKGDRSEDGMRFTPEEVVTGSFRTAVGTITAIDPAKGELTITQTMQNNQPLIVRVSKDSVLKRVPAEAMAMMGGGGGAPAGAGAGGGERRVVVQGGQPAAGGGQAATPGQGAGQGGARRPGGGFDLQQMFENLPPTTLAELKPGSMIVISSTVGADPSRVTAIQVLSGIEPIMAMMAARQGGGRGPGGAGGLGAGAAAGAGFGFGIGAP
jgi:Cu/Ag efflux protein CusF